MVVVFPPQVDFALYFDFDWKGKNSARIQDKQLELNGQKKFMEGRMELVLGSVFVGSDLN